MAPGPHVGDRLQALLDGRLDAAQAEEAARHLAACAACAEERQLVTLARALVGATPEVQARPGFAVRVALAAADARARPFGGLSWRWALGGLGGAAVAAGVLLAVGTGRTPERSQELLLAQRLDLYEDLSVMQHREALENLEVVEQLDKLEVGTP